MHAMFLGARIESLHEVWCSWGWGRGADEGGWTKLGRGLREGGGRVFNVMMLVEGAYSVS